MKTGATQELSKVSPPLPLALVSVIPHPEGRKQAERCEVQRCHMHKAALSEQLEVLCP